jgi:hypothetical protein
MRALLIAVLAAGLLLAGCSGEDEVEGDDRAAERDDADAEQAETAPRRVRGEIDVAVEPLTLDELPETPEPGFGRAVLGDRVVDFAVTFCDGEQPIGTGEGEGVEVAWDIREEDDDHRVAVRLEGGEERFVRAGPAEAEVDAEAGVVRFAGAFVPFQSDDGDEAVRGGFVAVCELAEAEA